MQTSPRLQKIFDNDPHHLLDAVSPGQQRAYDCLVRVLCDGDKPNHDQHRNGVTVQELEAKYQELFIGKVANE